MSEFFKHPQCKLLSWVSLLAGLIMMIFTLQAQAQVTENIKQEASTFWDDVSTNHQVQIGIDAWSLKKNIGPAGYQDNESVLFLADSYPHGQFRNVSPWIKVDAKVRSANKVLQLRYDGNQSVGSRVDELSMDWSHHSLGVRAGILSYKLSWCRTHDLDAPWIRENDPFCVVRTTSNPIKSSPGIQTYVNSVIKSYKVQSVIGIYRPMFMNYETNEFNAYNNPNIYVVRNNKYGMSINAIDLDNGMELRLSFLRAKQLANYAATSGPSQQIDQGATWRFAALSANVSPEVNVRVSYLNSTESSDFKYPTGYVTPGDTYPELFYTLDRGRTSKVLELNYQHNAQNMFSIAYSRYAVEDQDQNALVTSRTAATSYNPLQRRNFRNNSMSLGWRRDWQKGIFTVIQYTAAKVNQEMDSNPGVRAIQYTQSSGQALGFRLGYSF